jgi:hypothetical protein
MYKILLSVYLLQRKGFKAGVVAMINDEMGSKVVTET